MGMTGGFNPMTDMDIGGMVRFGMGGVGAMNTMATAASNMGGVGGANMGLGGASGVGAMRLGMGPIGTTGAAAAGIGDGWQWWRPQARRVWVLRRVRRVWAWVAAEYGDDG